MIPDDLDTIAKEVADFSQKYTYVITSGGVGPTHDDLTFEGKQAVKMCISNILTSSCNTYDVVPCNI